MPSRKRLTTARTQLRVRKVAMRVVASRQPEPHLDDPDNPEWTSAEFASAEGPEALSEAELAAFPKTKRRGRPPGTTKPDAKKAVTLRLDPEVLEKFKATGPGWQTRINDALLKAAI